MLKKIWSGLVFLSLISGCQESDILLEAKNHQSEFFSELLDSLAFDVQHPQVQLADSLFYSGSEAEAYPIYDSLLLTDIHDSYLKVYLENQSARNGLTNRTKASADSLFRLRTEALENLPRKPFCLQLQLAYLESNLSYRIAGFDHSFPIHLLLSDVENINLTAPTEKLMYDVMETYGHINLFNNFDPYRAKSFYGKLESLIVNGLEISPRRKGHLNYFLAMVYRQLNDFSLAIDYAEKSVQFLEQANEYNFQAYSMGEKLNNYGMLGDIENGALLFRKIQEFFEIHDIQQSIQFLVLRNYIGALNYSESFAEIDQLLPALEKQMNREDTSQIAEILEQKSWLAEANNEFKKAIDYYKEAIKIYQQYSEHENWHLGNYYSNIGEFYIQEGQMDSAIINFHKGIQIESGNNFELANFPSEKTLMALDEVVITLERIARALQKSDFPTGSLEKNNLLSDQYYQYLIGLFDQHTEGKEDQALLRDVSNFHDVFSGAIRCKLLSTLGFDAHRNEIFNLMEKSKAILLQNSVYARAFADQLGVPDSLFQALMNIEEEIAYHQTDSEIDGDLNDESGVYMTMVNTKKQLLSQIEKTHPEFLNGIRTSKNIELKDVQKQLNNSETLIQYHWTSNDVYAISISKDEVLFRHIEEVDKLNNILTKFIEQIQSPPGNEIEESAENFLSDAIWLDSTLLSGLYDQKSTKNLIIVPDGILGQLPFEILTSTIPNEGFTFYDIDYHVRNVDISYGFSSSLFFQQKNINKKIRRPEIKLFAYSDKNEISNHISDVEVDELPSSSKEVDEIARVLSSYPVEKWKGSSCIKTNFIRESINADVLHLALHGQSDPINRWGNKIMFRGDATVPIQEKVVYGYELRGMNLKSSFVFLSACESGKGKIESGEGVYSLGRNFAGAGVPSIVMGLWNLNDEISKRIVVDFYGELKNGTAPSMALKYAKNQHLENADDRLAHPYYWAPTIAIGGGKSPFK